MTESAALLLAYLLDLLIGDPGRIPHPVKGIGWAITKTGKILNDKIVNPEQKTQSRYHGLKSIKINSIIHDFLKRVKEGLTAGKREKLAGVILVVIITGLTYFLFHLISTIFLEVKLTTFPSYLFLAVFVYLVSTTIATRELLKSGKAVIDEAGKDNIEDARKKLSMIVGRDTKWLDRKSILQATIETLSENASDGIVAPMFYFAVGGLPLAMVYKAVNTLDSMVGYKNERYKNFGWASARLDDAVNYIPARITGFLIVAAALIISFFRLIVSEFSKWRGKAGNGSKLEIRALLNNIKRNFTKAKFMNGIDAFRIMIRDGRKHSSPNSGIPEAAMAGALGVRLGGPAIYGRVFVNKAYIGEERQSSPADSDRTGLRGQAQSTDNLYLEASEEAVTITKITSFLGLLAALAILYIRVALWS